MMSFCVKERCNLWRKCFWLRTQDVVGSRLLSRRAGGESKTYISGFNIDISSQKKNLFPLIQTGSVEFNLLKNMLTRDNLQNVNLPIIFPRSSSCKIHLMTSRIEWTRWSHFSDNGKYDDFFMNLTKTFVTYSLNDTVSIPDDNANFDLNVDSVAIVHATRF